MLYVLPRRIPLRYSANRENGYPPVNGIQGTTGIVMDKTATLQYGLGADAYYVSRIMLRKQSGIIGFTYAGLLAPATIILDIGFVRHAL